MRNDHGMYSDRAAFLLACHFLSEPERALLVVRMKVRVDAHEPIDLKKEDPAKTNFSREIMKAVIQTNYTKSDPEPETEEAEIVEIHQVHQIQHVEVTMEEDVINQEITIDDKKLKNDEAVKKVTKLDDVKEVNEVEVMEHSYADIIPTHEVQMAPTKSLVRLEQNEHLVFIKCKLCKKKVRKDIFEKHSSEEHPEERTDDIKDDSDASSKSDKYCTLCRKHFSKVNDFKRHQESIHKEEMHLFEIDLSQEIMTHNCQLCSESFLNQTILKYHYKSEHNKFMSTCKLCYMVLYSKNTDHRHKHDYHKEDIHLFGSDVDFQKVGLNSKCLQCELSFASDHLLNWHIKYVHSNNINNSMGRIIVRGGNKTNKVEEKEVENVKKSEVIKTEKVEVKKLEKMNHDEWTSVKKESTDHVERPWSCTHCTSSFHNKFRLKRHMKNLHNLLLE